MLVKFTSDLSRRIEYSYGAVYDLRFLASQKVVCIITFGLSVLFYFIFARKLFFLCPVIVLLYFLARR